MVNTMIHLKRLLVLAFLDVGVPILSGFASPALAQTAEPELPLVVAGKMPLYPTMARLARVTGVVRITVTTDGEKISSLEAVSGPPMLVKFAKDNILTWEFAKHKPTTFITTFDYLIEGPDQCMYSNGSSILNLPLEVRISAKGLKTCDPGAAKNPHP
jgi:hypothetical protein